MCQSRYPRHNSTEQGGRLAPPRPLWRAGVLLWQAISLLFLSGTALADETYFERCLPQGYIGGKTLSVSLTAEVYWGTFYADVFETLPAGWTLVSSEPSVKHFDPHTQTLHWHLELEPQLHGMPWDAEIYYDLTPPLDAKDEALFKGHCYYAFTKGDPVAYAQTKGQATIPRGATRLVPQEYPTIQAAMDASAPGDTVVVSANGTPYVERVETKEWMDLAGAPDSPPPVLQSTGVAIKAAPHTRVRGLHISCGTTGVWADHHVEVSNCLITGVQWAAIWFESRPGLVANCTIVGNGYGVYAGSNRPDVIVTNCIVRNNALPGDVPPFPRDLTDVAGAHVTFSCLEHPVYMGSGEKNISADPMFVNPADRDFRLLPASPCIDGGDNDTVAPGATDLEGNPRIMFGGKGLRVDMGAYEFRAESPGFEPLSGAFRLVWGSRPGRTYSVFFSDDLDTWHLADDNVTSSGAFTLWTEPIGWPPTVPIRVYRVMENE
jgi:hypothetical protein